MKTFFEWLFVILTNTCIISANIIRLPCRRHGNFSVAKIGVRKTGDVFRTIENVDKTRCCLHCVSDDQCAYVNHKRDNSKCELLMKNDSMEEVDQNWQFLSTDYESRNVGPFCKNTQPCPAKEFCYDTCNANNYICHGLVKKSVFTNLEANGNVQKLPRDSRFPDKPTRKSYLSEMLDESIGNVYGVLLQGYFVAPKNGEYYFYASSINGCELRFGSSFSDSNLIVKPTVYSGKFKWHKSVSQKSQPIRLVKGQKYYLELRVAARAGIDGDHQEIGVRLPGTTDVVLITHEYLHHYP